MEKHINIVYYSGTGGTQRVAKIFESEFLQKGYTVQLQHLFHGTPVTFNDKAPLLILFAVHAFNAPDAVYQWIDDLKPVNDVTALVISVSGGGEVTPNTACRLRAIRHLEKKGYKVSYEEMLVMPSNWIVATKRPLAKMLLDVIPIKVKSIITAYELGMQVRTKPKGIDRVLARVGLLEKYGARSFGKHIKCSDSCNGCGWCSKHCPSGNISLLNERPTFDKTCHMCLNCIYGCPQKALTPTFLKFVVIKEGYDLNALEKEPHSETAIDVDQMTKGYLWSGLRKYFNNSK